MNWKKTIQGHIDFIRVLIRQTSDDTSYSDEWIYKALIDSRSKVLDRYMRQNKRLGPANYMQFCLGLEKDSLLNCCPGCSDDCQVRKAEFPQVFYNSRGLPLINVTSKDGKNSYAFSPPSDGKYLQYRPRNKNRPHYYIYGSQLILFNSLRTESVRIVGLVTDVEEASDCNTDSSCFDPSTAYFPLSPVLNDDVYLTFLSDKMGISMKMADDLYNNARDDATQQQQQ